MGVLLDRARGGWRGERPLSSRPVATDGDPTSRVVLPGEPGACTQGHEGHRCHSECHERPRLPVRVVLADDHPVVRRGLAPC